MCLLPPVTVKFCITFCYSQRASQASRFRTRTNSSVQAALRLRCSVYELQHSLTSALHSCSRLVSYASTASALHNLALQRASEFTSSDMKTSEGYFRALFSASVTLTLAILGRSVQAPQQLILLRKPTAASDSLDLPLFSTALLVVLPFFVSAHSCARILWRLQLLASCAICLLQDRSAAWHSCHVGRGWLQLPDVPAAAQSSRQNRT